MSEDQSDYITDANEMMGKGYNDDPIPPTEFTSTVSGFTLAPDAIVADHGFVTALVWGVVWRYCQMSDGVCRASQTKLADRLGMSVRTIIRHLGKLCDDGYLFDVTPDLRNKPHIYADTGKIKVRMNLSAMTESHTGMTKSHSRYDRESIEESIKKQIKKQNQQEEATDPKNIYLLYSEEIGVITPSIADALKDWENDVPEKWIKDAILEASASGARNWKYVQAILKRWHEQGHQGENKPANENKPTKKKGKKSQVSNPLVPVELSEQELEKLRKYAEQEMSA